MIIISQYTHFLQIYQINYICYHLVPAIGHSHSSCSQIKLKDKIKIEKERCFLSQMDSQI